MDNFRSVSSWLAIPALLFLLLFLGAPLVMLVRLSFCLPADGRGFYQAGTWTLTNYTQLDLHDGRLVLFTLILALGLAFLSTAIAYPIALWIDRLSTPWKLLAILLVLLPKLASVLVVVFGLLIALSSSGPVNRLFQALGSATPWPMTHNLTGAVLGELELILPYAVLLLVLGLKRIPSALPQAARGLGASSWHTFWRITWPLSRPDLLLVGQLAFLWGIGAFLGPLILGNPDQTTLAVEVQLQAFDYNNWPRAATLAVLMLTTLLLSWLGMELLRSRQDRPLKIPGKDA